MNNAHPTSSTSSAAASTHGAASPSLELCDARRARDSLATLLRAEQFAMADFDQRRGWQPLGYSTLFAFLHFDLKLPNPSAYWRKSAAEALHRFPDLIEPLRDGRLCCSSTAELAKVLTEENKATVLPRFFGLSSREAQEVVAELQPRQAPATRTIVTKATSRPAARATVLEQPGLPTLSLVPALAPLPAASPALSPHHEQHPNAVPLSQLRTPEVDFGGVDRAAPRPDEIEPLSAERRRLHVNVSKAFVKKLQSARSGLSHSIPSATLEQVLEAALDLLLEKQAKARGQVKRPRDVATKTAACVETARAAAAPGEAAAPRMEAEGVKSSRQSPAPVQQSLETAQPLALASTEPPSARRTGHREAITAAVRRAVWERDGGRCCWPLDGGGVCGSTHQLELDHIVPWARFGGRTEENLRLTCHRHNALAARRSFGERWMERYQGGRQAT